MRKAYVVFVLMGLMVLLFTSNCMAEEYIVKKGDSLWKIARQHKTTVDKLKKINNLKSEHLTLGQRLSLPDEGQTDGVPYPAAEVGDRGNRDRNVSLGGSVAGEGTAMADGVSRGAVLRRSVVSRSFAYLGRPYRYGGTSPRGFDCSGFVGYVFRSCGIVLPRDSASQSRLGSSVEKSELVAGDLVFFHTGGSRRINHVGIYIGDGKFIHASTHEGITVTSLESDYYRRCYAGAKRVIE